MICFIITVSVIKSSNKRIIRLYTYWTKTSLMNKYSFKEDPCLRPLRPFITFPTLFLIFPKQIHLSYIITISTFHISWK